jgi:hypothetical protein
MKSVLKKETSFICEFRFQYVIPQSFGCPVSSLVAVVTELSGIGRFRTLQDNINNFIFFFVVLVKPVKVLTHKEHSTMF